MIMCADDTVLYPSTESYIDGYRIVSETLARLFEW